MIDLNQLIENAPKSEPDIPLPSLEEQKRIAAKLKELDEKGELTPEILEAYFGSISKQSKQ